MGLLHFFRPRSVLEFVQEALRALVRAPCLFVHGAEFLVFQPHQDLAFFHFVAFFDADPGQASCDLRVHVDLVVSDDVSGRGKHRGTALLGDLRRFGRGARNFDFGSLD